VGRSKETSGHTTNKTLPSQIRIKSFNLPHPFKSEYLTADYYHLDFTIHYRLSSAILSLSITFNTILS